MTFYRSGLAIVTYFSTRAVLCTFCIIIEAFFAKKVTLCSSREGYFYIITINEKRRRVRRLFRLHEIGFEPMTSTTSRWHSPAELLVHCSLLYKLCTKREFCLVVSLVFHTRPRYYTINILKRFCKKTSKE